MKTLTCPFHDGLSNLTFQGVYFYGMPFIFLVVVIYLLKENEPSSSDEFSYCVCFSVLFTLLWPLSVTLTVLFLLYIAYKYLKSFAP